MRSRQVLLGLIILFAAACVNHTYKQTGLDMQITPDSGGTTTLTANGVDDITVAGFVQLDSGSFKLEVVNPEGITVKQFSVNDNQRYTLALKCTAIPGAWTIKYASDGGIGRVQIAMRQAMTR